MNLLAKQRLTDFEKEPMVAGGRMGGKDSQGVWDGLAHTTVFNMDSQQGPSVQHMELCSMFLAPWMEGEKVYMQMHG